MATVSFYNSYFNEIQKGTFDMINNTLKLALVNGYTFDASHDYFSDISGEASGTGYTSGGATLTGKTVGTVGNGVFDADDVEWTDSTITATGAVLYKDTGTESTSPLIEYIDFEGSKSTQNGTFKIVWNASGILKIQSA